MYLYLSILNRQWYTIKIEHFNQLSYSKRLTLLYLKGINFNAKLYYSILYTKTNFSIKHGFLGTYLINKFLSN